MIEPMATGESPYTCYNTKDANWVSVATFPDNITTFFLATIFYEVIRDMTRFSFHVVLLWRPGKAAKCQLTSHRQVTPAIALLKMFEIATRILGIIQSPVQKSQ